MAPKVTQKRPAGESHLERAAASFADNFNRLPLRTPDGSLLGIDSREAFAHLLATWVIGSYRLLKRVHPTTAKRYTIFTFDLRREYQDRLRRCPDKADEWLLRQLDEMRLPDLRTNKNVRRDGLRVAQYDKLKKNLEPYFKRGRRPAHYLKEIARIVSATIDKQVYSNGLPHPGDETLTEYCLEVLKTNAVTLSRARRRSKEFRKKDPQRAILWPKTD